MATNREALYTILPSPDSTLAVEIVETGLTGSRKYMLFFEAFRGELAYDADRPENSRLNLLVDATHVLCRDAGLSAKKQQRVAEYARHEALACGRHPEIRFASTRLYSKPLRGFVVEGVLSLRGATCNVNVNVVLTEMKRQTIQLDGDAILRLTELGMTPPSRLFGLIRAKNEVLLRILLWAKSVDGAA